MSNLHLPSQLTLEEMRRVLTAMQSQPSTAQSSPVSTSASPLASGGGSGGGILSGGVGATGPTGATGPVGPAGGIDPTLMVMALTEEEDIVTTGKSNVVSDGDGFAVTSNHVTWSIVTDNNGVMITVG